MSANLTSESTVVPIAGDQDVIVEPGQPWPSTYRGSKYSLVHSQRHDMPVLRWQYKDLVTQIEPPEGLVERLQDYGKSHGSGKGSVRITADGEVLSKIHSSDYINARQAPVKSGWIPVYLGKVGGDLGFEVNNDPTPLTDGVGIWSGLPFDHGERWAVSYNDKLVWKWKGYRFYSAFEHPELIEMYQRYRRVAGRFYVTETGHIFGNVRRSEIPDDRRDEVAELFSDWQRNAEQSGDKAALRLVNRRLKVTGDGDPQQGCLPLHLGHLSQFDDGLLPRPVVDDEAYYVEAARGEVLSSY